MIDRIDSFTNFKKLNEIGIALSKQKNINTLLEEVLTSAREITGADAGTLYIVNPDRKSLRFAITQNDTLEFLNSAKNPDSLKNIPLVQLYDENNQPNLNLVITRCVLDKKVINIKDAYNPENKDFDFSKTKLFDNSTGYKSRSFLCAPMQDHEGNIIAAIQLINKTEKNGTISYFDATDRELVESLASQAGLVLNNQKLIADLKNLFDSFVQVIANAIDDKSAHTGAHCRRMPIVTRLFNNAINTDKSGFYKNVELSEDEKYEIEIAAWLHDCGKIVTPPHVMEKGTKLFGMLDKLEWIIARLEVYKRDLYIDFLNKKYQALERGDLLDDAAEKIYKEQESKVLNYIQALKESNKGSENTPDEIITVIGDIAKLSYINYKGKEQKLIEEEELENLSVKKGTLNEKERKIIESHVIYSKKMLTGLPFPQNMSRVPEYAGAHHEKLNGKGYPHGLTAEDLPLGTRILTISDVFEALTAPDRPYKEALPLSVVFKIMRNMALDNHLDKNLFNLFITSGAYEIYSKEHLLQKQQDIDNANKFLI